MKKTVGSVTVSNTDPPHRTVKGNQATFVLLPIFISFVLVLLTTLSEPTITGLSVANVDSHRHGTISFGTWGWCAHGVPNITSVLSKPSLA